jgi:hypothetical protein
VPGFITTTMSTIITAISSTSGTLAIAHMSPLEFIILATSLVLVVWIMGDAP